MEVINTAKNKKYLSLKAICPYYKSEEKQLIYCEGVQRDTALHISFSYPADKVKYREKYCENCYKECRIAKMLGEADA